MDIGTMGFRLEMLMNRLVILSHSCSFTVCHVAIIHFILGLESFFTLHASVSYFSCDCKKTLEESNLMKEGFILTHDIGQQGHEAAGHKASIVRKQRDFNAHAQLTSSLLSNPRPWPMESWGLNKFTLDIAETCLLGHTRSCQVGLQCSPSQHSCLDLPWLWFRTMDMGVWHT